MEKVSSKFKTIVRILFLLCSAVMAIFEFVVVLIGVIELLCIRCLLAPTLNSIGVSMSVRIYGIINKHFLVVL